MEQPREFYLALPAGYREVYHVDAKNKKTGLLLNGVGLLLTLVLVVPAVLLTDLSALNGEHFLLYDLVFLGSLLSYLVLHELVHGAAYKLLTKQKLTFGFSWSCAFCGVPQCYVSRRIAMLSAAAPFVVFSFVFSAAAVLLHPVSEPLFLLFSLLFAIHVGGCTGDLYLIQQLLTRYRHPAALMRDTGPEQWIYEPAAQAQRAAEPIGETTERT